MNSTDEIDSSTELGSRCKIRITPLVEDSDQDVTYKPTESSSSEDSDNGKDGVRNTAEYSNLTSESESEHSESDPEPQVKKKPTGIPVHNHRKKYSLHSN